MKIEKKKGALPTHRACVCYSGRVQGVGFRFTAEKLALDLGLVGCVKNLPDGRVELICEGSEEKIKELLQKICQSSLGPHIKKTTCCWERPTHGFTDFSVEFCH
jgi:acylphosphatase